MAELFTSLPRHLYCYVERRFLGEGTGLEPCSWFGLTSLPARAWGLSVLLECGAVYTQVPPHALYFPVPGGDFSETAWPLARAQLWDCFGYAFAVHEYTQLALAGGGARARWPNVEGELAGRYLFTAQHYGDAYSQTPEQAKQFHFLALENGRLTALPGTNVLFGDACFTTDAGWPKWLRTQQAVYRCET